MRSLSKSGIKYRIRYVYINDTASQFKVHVFKIYQCGKIMYNQLLNGEIFYRRWILNNWNNNGYCGLLTPKIKSHFLNIA